MDLFLGIIPSEIPSELWFTLAWPIIIYSGVVQCILYEFKGTSFVTSEVDCLRSYLKGLYDNNKKDFLDLSLFYEIDVQHLSEMIWQVLSEPSVFSHISFPSQ